MLNISCRILHITLQRLPEACPKVDLTSIYCFLILTCTLLWWRSVQLHVCTLSRQIYLDICLTVFKNIYGTLIWRLSMRFCSVSVGIPAHLFSRASLRSVSLMMMDEKAWLLISVPVHPKVLNGIKVRSLYAGQSNSSTANSSNQSHVETEKGPLQTVSAKH